MQGDGPRSLVALADGLIRAAKNHVLEHEGLKVFVEVIAPPPRLVVFGAVDTAEAICGMAKLLGWTTIVADARARFATPERLPSADQIIVAWPEEAIAQIAPDHQTAVVVLTHDDKFDVPAIKGALATDAFYVGALGSRRNQEKRRERLLEAGVPEAELAEFLEGAELARSAYAPFDIDSYRAGHLTPVFFGSALKDFTVGELLRAVAEWAPPPRPQPGEPRAVRPEEPRVTGFVFKVQANMDPNHRDRVAFMRLCSGRFQRGMKLKQVRTGKIVAVNAPIFFFAHERALAEEALPGDIVGIPNHGILRVGDTMTEGETVRFTGIPNFAPELLRRILLDDPMRTKQMRKALEDLAEEGVVQVFRPVIGTDWIVGVVGALQLDVMASRIDAEYKVPVRFEQAPYETARWISSDDPVELKAFIAKHRGSVAEDRDDAPVFLARNAWELNYTKEHAPKITFAATRERS